MNAALVCQQPGFIQQAIEFIIGYLKTKYTVIQVWKSESLIGKRKGPAVDPLLPFWIQQAVSFLGRQAGQGNIINKDIQDLAVVLPIPANMAFNGEVTPASAQASIDGKNYMDMPLMRKVDGKMVKIPFSEYRTLRWNIKLLPAQKSAAVSLNTIVE